MLAISTMRPHRRRWPDVYTLNSLQSEATKMFTEIATRVGFSYALAVVSLAALMAAIG